MNTIGVSDFNFLTYLNYCGIEPIGGSRDPKTNKVTFTYEYNEEFTSVKNKYGKATDFDRAMSARHRAEEMLRMTL